LQPLLCARGVAAEPLLHRQTPWPGKPRQMLPIRLAAQHDAAAGSLAAASTASRGTLATNGCTIGPVLAVPCQSCARARAPVAGEGEARGGLVRTRVRTAETAGVCALTADSRTVGGVLAVPRKPCARARAPVAGEGEAWGGFVPAALRRWRRRCGRRATASAARPGTLAANGRTVGGILAIPHQTGAGARPTVAAEGEARRSRISAATWRGW